VFSDDTYMYEKIPTQELFMKCLHRIFITGGVCITPPPKKNENDDVAKYGLKTKGLNGQRATYDINAFR